MYCTKCGAEIEENENFCSVCGAKIEHKTEQVFSNDSREIDNQVPVNEIVSTKKKPFYYILFAGVLVWLIVPFAAVNLATLEHMPSAFMIATQNVDVIGDLTNTVTFWATVFVFITFLVCFFCIKKEKMRIMRIMCALAEIIMLFSLAETYDWLDDQGIGIGFWIIAVLLAVLFLKSRKKNIP